MVQTFKRKDVYSDFDMDFNINPLTGDLARKKDDLAIGQSVRNLIYTNFFERPFQPFIGSNIRGLLFENPDPIIIQNIRRQILELLANYEPRVNVIDVLVNDKRDMNAYEVTITYRINNLDEPVNVTMVLRRLR